MSDATDSTARAPAPGRGARGDTRERIVDVALELFIAQGYDKTSLRDIADRLGVTKAALYYHFERKEDIFLELHLRLHALGREILEQFEGLDGPQLAAAWPRLIDAYIDLMVEHRDLFLVHMRNRGAVEAVQNSPRHAAEQEDMEQALERALTHPELSVRQRVRMVASIGATMAGLIGSAQLFADVPPERLAELVRDTVHGLAMPAED